MRAVLGDMSLAACSPAGPVPGWSRVLPDEPSVRDVFGGVGLDEAGRIHAVSCRQDLSGDSGGLLRVEALTPQGELLWQVEHPLSWRIENCHVVATSTGTIMAAVASFSHAALLVEFDASGALQWSHQEDSLYLHAGRWVSSAVPAPGGGMFVNWGFAGDHDTWFVAARYDAAGALLYGVDPGGRWIADIFVGPDSVFYTLDVDPDGAFAQIAPHLP